MRKTEKDKRDRLFELMRDNPDLPIVVTTSYRDEVCRLNTSYISEYYRGESEVFLKISSTMREVICDIYGEETCDKMTDKEFDEACAAIPWVKAIIVVGYERRECGYFNCTRRGGYYCCLKCDKYIQCRNACLNNPDKCGLYKKEIKYDDRQR